MCNIVQEGKLAEGYWTAAGINVAYVVISSFLVTVSATLNCVLPPTRHGEGYALVRVYVCR